MAKTTARRPDRLPPPRGLRLVWVEHDLAVLHFDLPEIQIPKGLSPAEGEVIGLVLEGQTNGEIARHRRTAPRTVANQVASIFRKLRVGSRAELYARLIRDGHKPRRR
jgi:DNA-binding CsgD family transcriptional regulator